MDFNQEKLTREEWNSIEIKVSQDKIDILTFIKNGFHDVNITQPRVKSILNYLKIDIYKNIHEFIFNKFFSIQFEELYNIYSMEFLNIKIKPSKLVIKNADKIRIDNFNLINSGKVFIYEIIMLKNINELMKNYKNNNNKWLKYYYNIFQFSRHSDKTRNIVIDSIVSDIIVFFNEEVTYEKIVLGSVDIIEKNDEILKYQDIKLYEHQKQIFTYMKNPNPKLILYVAPTGTGKTLTPLGLSERYRVIYVCAARHIGLMLARSAISIEKKIAFAFGCDSPADIKLHYFSAVDYTVHRKTGGIFKVDNSVGTKVEIIISDVKSYLPAMNYMKAFNNVQDIIMYLDEPTIFLDYQDHPLHSIIHKNWKENEIPNVVLSSATLPKTHEIQDVISDFKEKFEECEIFENIQSYDFKKSIPVIDNNGYTIAPHNLTQNYEEFKKIINHCKENMTILRYVDLGEIVKYIGFMKNRLNSYYPGLEYVNIESIKLYYLELLDETSSEVFYDSLLQIKKSKYFNTSTILTKSHSLDEKYSLSGTELRKIKSMNNAELTANDDGSFGVYITTSDAYTLNDGPTIFITDDVEKTARFYLQKSKIPGEVMSALVENIEKNDKINEQIKLLEKNLEDIVQRKQNKNDTEVVKKKDSPKNTDNDREITKINDTIDFLKSKINLISLDEVYIPNKQDHLNKWAYNMNYLGIPFTSEISEDIIIKVMNLNIDNKWKILLFMGIGTFGALSDNIEEEKKYLEIMKILANNQNLFFIIATSDYIYGTDYQFCNSYISKTLNLTHQKLIQAMGRVGRGNLQQIYTIRFRNNHHLKLLFLGNEAPEEDVEIINMNKLFKSF